MTSQGPARWAGPLFTGHKCSLGYAVAEWIERNCVHGPGDIQGKPVQLDLERLAFIVDAYEIDPDTGERIVDEAVLSRMKGWAKSELAGWIALAEAAGPVRFARWDAYGQPVGRRVTAPLIKVLATEEGQAAENTYAVCAYIVYIQQQRWKAGRDDAVDTFNGWDFGRDWQTSTRILLPSDDGIIPDEDADWDPDGGGGKIVYCSSGAASKDGGKESFVVADETHLYVLPALKSMYATVSRNLTKRSLSEPWLLQTTTMYRPGEQSIAEATIRGHKQSPRPSLLFDHREAKGKLDLANKAKTIEQIKQARGLALFINPERVYRQMTKPGTLPEDAERYYLNRARAGSDTYFDHDATERQCVGHMACQAVDGSEVTLGFDGSINDDATVLIGKGRCAHGELVIFPVAIWAKPEGPLGAHWEVPRLEVHAKLREAFGRWKVRRLNADPHEWRSEILAWVIKWGEEIVRQFPTSAHKATAEALDRLRVDLITGRVWLNGDPVMIEHFGNAYVHRVAGHKLIRKENPNSDRKIDGAMGATLANEGWAEIEAADAKPPPPPKKQISTAMYGFN